jgi:hypothetical protein
MSFSAHRLISACALIGALQVAPASGQATAPSPTAPGAARGSAALLDCHAAVDQAGRFASFQGAMTAVAHTQRMAIRIDLEERVPTVSGFRAVSAPGLGVWRRSATGVKIYRYVKQVTNLPAPASFRAVVRFRWLGAGDSVIRRATRRTETCVQRDERPQLNVGAVTITASPQSSDAQYEIAVRNDGRGPAGAFGVALTVNGASQQTLSVPSLAAGARTVLDAVAPRCATGSSVQIDLDPQHQVDEATGGGQSKTVTCRLATASQSASRHRAG